MLLIHVLLSGWTDGCCVVAAAVAAGVVVVEDAAALRQQQEPGAGEKDAYRKQEHMK
jgi:hypothetical protein